eukprot:jgi/Ulvmu1/3044/UM015_0084.1
MRSKGGKETKVIAPASLTPREASAGTTAILAVAAALVGALVWRARRSQKQSGDSKSTRGSKVLKSPPPKTQGGRRVNNKKKSKTQKQASANQKTPERTKGQSQTDRGESVLYTNHRYFNNPNGAAVPLSMPTTQPKQ